MAAPSAIVPSDALVFFGASGDLAYEQIFPSLLGLVRDEGLVIPIIGVAKSGWNLDKLKNRAKDSLAQHGAVDKPAQDKLLSLLRYIDGDYADPRRSRSSTRSFARRSGRCTTWRCRRACSVRWRRPWPSPAPHGMRAW